MPLHYDLCISFTYDVYYCFFLAVSDCFWLLHLHNLQFFVQQQRMQSALEENGLRRIYIYIYMCVCVCVCVCIYIYIYIIKRQ